MEILLLISVLILSALGLVVSAITLGVTLSKQNAPAAHEPKPAEAKVPVRKNKVIQRGPGDEYRHEQELIERTAELLR